MSDRPTRLLEEGTEFERLLLQSSESEEPSPALERQILAAVMASPDAGAADSSQVRGALKAPGLRVVRPVAVATMAFGLLVGGSLLLGRTPAPAPVPSIPASPAGVTEVASPAPEPPVEVPTVTPDSLPTAPAVVPSAQIARPRGPASAAPTSQNPKLDTSSSLEREIALLDSVKTKLGAGAATDAARALDAYDAEFPQGTLRPEATVLRIRTLLLQGKRPEAQQLADDFLAKHPGSVHAKRIRALLAN